MQNEISIIVAFSINNVIGYKGHIPWDIPEDRARFKELTLGNVVIMGRCTFEEIFAKFGRSLPKRKTIVVSKTKVYEDEDCQTVSSLDDAFSLAEKLYPEKKIFICGGERIFRESLPRVEKIYATEVGIEVPGDVFLPEEVRAMMMDSPIKVDNNIDCKTGIPFTFKTYVKDEILKQVQNDMIFQNEVIFQNDKNIQTDTLPNGYKILQDKKSFMYGIDAVLLARFATSGIRKNDTVVELCTGNGIIPLLLEHSSNAKKIFGVEIQKKSADLAKKSVELNNLQEKITIIQDDIKSVSKHYAKHSVQVVISNPPYMKIESCKKCGTDAKTIARHEVLCDLDDVIRAADYLLQTHGTFFMIHRPCRLPEIFESFAKNNLVMKRMQLIYPFEDKPANMVLIEARKNAKQDLIVEKPLIVRDKNCNLLV